MAADAQFGMRETTPLFVAAVGKENLYTWPHGRVVKYGGGVGSRTKFRNATEVAGRLASICDDEDVSLMSHMHQVYLVIRAVPTWALGA